ncbi:uncharacterized protein [Primulina eburnea]|uniref:uncharacterized protein n=1 Tax=Primulina eburnea TaxID=1245227 RepID=UPI003C6C629F
MRALNAFIFRDQPRSSNFVSIPSSINRGHTQHLSLRKLCSHNSFKIPQRSLNKVENQNKPTKVVAAAAAATAETGGVAAAGGTTDADVTAAAMQMQVENQKKPTKVVAAAAATAETGGVAADGATTDADVTAAAMQMLKVKLNQLKTTEELMAAATAEAVAMEAVEVANTGAAEDGVAEVGASAAVRLKKLTHTFKVLKRKI